MTCKEADQFLIDYVSGDLDSATRVRFDEHIIICKSCRAYLANYKQTMRLAKESMADDGSDASAKFPEELLEAIIKAKLHDP